MKKIANKEDELIHLSNNHVLLSVIKKGANEEVWAIDSKQDLKKFIRGITSNKIKSENFNIYFLSSETAEKWFKDLYKEEFFNIERDKGIITLNALPNGIRRTRVYKKTVDNDKTLKNSLKRIKKSIKPYLDNLDFSFEIKVRPFSYETKETLSRIIIHLIDLNKNNSHFDDNKIEIRFNKKNWKYEFIYIHVPRDLMQIEKIIRWGFEKHTSSTRNYRNKRAK